MGDEGTPAMFAVEMKTNCPHLCDPVLRGTALGAPPRPEQDPRYFRTLLAKPCSVCGDGRENWVCLAPGCGAVCCSRYINGHFLAHFAETGHCLGKSFRDLSVVCLTCEEYVRHPGPEPTDLDAWEEGLYTEKFGASTDSTLLDTVVRVQHDRRRDETSGEDVLRVVSDAVQTQLLHASVAALPLRPATEAQLLRVEEVEDGIVAGTPERCAMCLELMASEVSRLPCNHVFHRLCLQGWLQQQAFCPVCRKDL